MRLPNQSAGAKCGSSVQQFTVETASASVHPAQMSIPAYLSIPGDRPQCVVNRRTLAKITSSRRPTGDTYHCCDENGCSGSVDDLTICPVIKIRCHYTENSCVCEEG
jgi:hypothetical protein